MFRCIVFTITLTLASFVVTVSAGAAPERYVYAGSIVFVTDPTGILSPAIQPGTPFTGEYEIDPDLGDTLFVLANGGTLYFNSAGNKLGGNLLTIAGELLVIAVAAVQVGDNQFNVPLGPVDVWGIGGFNPAAGTQSLDLRLSYFDTSTTQLSDEALFVNQTNDGWTNATLRIVQLDDTGQETVLAVGEVALAPPAVPGLARPLAFVALFLMLAVGGSRASFVHRPPAVS